MSAELHIARFPENVRPLILRGLPCEDVEKYCATDRASAAMCRDPEFWNSQIATRHLDAPAVWPPPGGGRESFATACRFERYAESRVMQRPHAAFHDRGDEDVAFSADGRSLVSCFYNRRVHSMTTWDVLTSRVQTSFDVRMDAVVSTRLAPYGATIAVAKRGTGKLELWDVASGTLRTTVDHHEDSSAIEFSPDGATVANGRGPLIRLWDVMTGQLRLTMTERFANAASSSTAGSVLEDGSKHGALNPTN